MTEREGVAPLGGTGVAPPPNVGGDDYGKVKGRTQREIF